MILIATTAVNVHSPQRSHVEIAELARAEEFLEDAYGAKMRLDRDENARRSAKLLIHERTAVGPFAVEDIRLAGDVQASTEPLHKVLVVWPTSGRLGRECGREVTEVAAGELALVSQPDAPHRTHAHDLHATSVMLDPSILVGVATALPTGQAPICFTSLQPVDGAASRLLKNTITYVKDVILTDDALATPLVLGHAARLLAAVTMSTFPNSLAAAPTTHDRTDHQPVLLRRAMEFMESNVANDIALDDVAEAVHVTPRAVQYMFRRHLETTPLQYLRRLRLHYAHQELQAADRTRTTVTDVAARWGFAHTGRFAEAYRETYGCTPHMTLRE
ncbi:MULTISPECIES: AraC family transcriptional regulator [unclassified Mycobacterium]|uniref:helix-turn-helix transcriptional regulator n=1 Tax=unclassified Mycobacterium TaxID=2642494 RepID=UPI0007404EDD|nr:MULTISPECIES: AraC family transcriptional regulator [unclassified Mycobacterium]KUH86120.1 AraC family transcriptional regulator [Mycobacterium sp. IS-1556]KUH86956.1 AraC family transcriptional regulator [Mycobacterium sp. GA-0227b]KUH92233.1 AraC family transcriptional regulator [Mycobacterium sp. GA-1999]